MIVLGKLWGLIWRGCWHWWSDWEDVGSHGIGRYQEKRCKKCGIRSQREVGVDMDRIYP